jgi:hypothetical protein
MKELALIEASQKILKHIKKEQPLIVKRQDLKRLNVLGNKHIPEMFKLTSEKNRLEILAGLLDTDGYYSRSMFISQYI